MTTPHAILPRLGSISVLFLAAAALGCGAAPPPTATASSLNVGQWRRFEVAEGQFSLELPGTDQPRREVATSAEGGTTYSYVVVDGPLAVTAAVEPFASVIAPAHETGALDAIGTVYVDRARERGCVPSNVRSTEHQGHPGRLMLATGCTSLDGGVLAISAFLHGSTLVTVAIAVEGAIDEESLIATLDRVSNSVQFGPAPSWFVPVDHPVDVADAGVRFAMPGPPERTERQIDDRTNIVRLVSEPIRGIAAIVEVSTFRGRRITAASVCDHLAQSETLALPSRENHQDAGDRFCRVGAQHAADPSLYEIHDVLEVDGAIVEMIWVGPHTPAFVGGGQAQLEQMRASLERIER
jgi:hypothetical protein